VTIETVKIRRTVVRAGVSCLVAAAVAIGSGFGTPVAAHVEVQADNPQAGATNVTVTFDVESESNSAGIASIQVVLPPAIPPADVTYVSGPTGWALTATADGYRVTGPPTPAGQDMTYVVRIGRLPTDATTLSFKTLQNYTDGRTDRWIEIPESGSGRARQSRPDPDPPGGRRAGQPTAAPRSAAPATSTSSPPDPAADPPTTRPAAGNSRAWIGVAGAFLILAIAGVILIVRRRRSAGTS
jgi:uncharacterized protein YcnI